MAGANRYGGASDWSGTFAALAREDLARIKEGVASALQTTKETEAAKDSDMYSKWQNGEISDQEWLSYLSQRVEDTKGSPEEHARYRDMLREHTGAVADAQMETKFQQGRVSASELMNYYRRRMGRVEHNSPAYRDLAGRYEQLVDYQQALNASGGSGGSGGSSSGGGKVNLKKMFPTGQKGLPEVQTPGYEPGGPNVITPTQELFNPNQRLRQQAGEHPDTSTKKLVRDIFTDSWESDFDRIVDLQEQAKNHPERTYLIDRVTGDQIPNTPEVRHALDNQAIRTTNMLAGTHWLAGNTKDSVYWTGKGSGYIGTYMAANNTDRVDDAIHEADNQFAIMLQQAESVGDPNERLKIYRQIGQAVEQFRQNNLVKITPAPNIAPHTLERVDAPNTPLPDTVETLPQELSPENSVYAWADGWTNFVTASTDPTLDDATRSTMADEAANGISGMGGLTPDEVKHLFFDEESQTGAVVALRQKAGLNNLDPDYPDERYTHGLDANGNLVMVPAALSIDPLTQHMRLVPTVDPATGAEGADPTGMVQMVTKVSGQPTLVWASLQKANDPRLLVYRFTGSETIDGTNYAEGDAVPSSVLSRWGESKLGDYVRQGVVQRDSAVQVVNVPGGITWFYDPETGNMSLGDGRTGLPTNFTFSQDAVTGGIQVGDGSSDTAPPISMAAIDHATEYPWGFFGITPREMDQYVTQAVQTGTLSLDGHLLRGPGGEASSKLTDITNLYYDHTADARNDIMALVNRIPTFQADRRAQFKAQEQFYRPENRDLLGDLLNGFGVRGIESSVNQEFRAPKSRMDLSGDIARLKALAAAQARANRLPAMRPPSFNLPQPRTQQGTQRQMFENKAKRYEGII